MAAFFDMCVFLHEGAQNLENPEIFQEILGVTMIYPLFRPFLLVYELFSEEVDSQHHSQRRSLGNGKGYHLAR